MFSNVQDSDCSTCCSCQRSFRSGSHPIGPSGHACCSVFRLLSVSNLLLDNEFGPVVTPYNGKPAPQILLYSVHQSLLLATNWSFYCWLQVACTCRYCGWLSLFILDICPFHFIFYLLAIFSIYCPFSLLSSHCLPYSQKFDPFLCIIRAQTGQQDDYLTWNLYDSYNECDILNIWKHFEVVACSYLYRVNTVRCKIDCFVAVREQFLGTVMKNIRECGIGFGFGIQRVKRSGLYSFMLRLIRKTAFHHINKNMGWKERVMQRVYALRGWEPPCPKACRIRPQSRPNPPVNCK